MYIHEQLMKTRHQDRLRAAARNNQAAATLRQAGAERPRRPWLTLVRRLARLHPTISAAQRAERRQAAPRTSAARRSGEQTRLADALNDLAARD